MDLFAAFATNAKTEEEGRFFPMGDAEFLIARSGNRSFQDQFSLIWKQYEHQLKGSQAAGASPEEKAFGDKLSFDLMGRVMARTILLGWKGNVRFKGQPLAYSAENAELLLGIKDFRVWVDNQAGEMKNYLLAQEAADEKNSVPTSSGNSNGALISSI